MMVVIIINLIVSLIVIFIMAIMINDLYDYDFTIFFLIPTILNL